MDIWLPKGRDGPPQDFWPSLVIPVPLQAVCLPPSGCVCKRAQSLFLPGLSPRNSGHFRQEASGGAALWNVRTGSLVGRVQSVYVMTHPAPQAESPWGRRAGVWREGGAGGSYQEAVVLGVGGQAQAKAHVVLPFGNVG